MRQLYTGRFSISWQPLDQKVHKSIRGSCHVGATYVRSGMSNRRHHVITTHVAYLGRTSLAPLHLTTTTAAPSDHITLIGPDNYAVEVRTLAQEMGQRPPMPILHPPVIVSQSESDDEKGKRKRRRLVAFPFSFSVGYLIFGFSTEETPLIRVVRRL